MIHPTAIIASTAQVDSTAIIGPYCIISDNVTIGANTELKAHVNVAGPTKIGANNTIYSFCSLGEAPQDEGYQGEPTELVVGDNNLFREYISISRGTVKGGGLTKIGSHNMFMAYVHIGHDCIVGDYVNMTNNTALAGHVEVDDYARLGGYTLVHQFCRIGTSAFTGMGAAINKDVTPYTLVAGNYARAVGINKIGLQRSGFSKEAIAGLTKAFKAFAQKRQSKDAALAETEALAQQHAEVATFVNFVSSSPRGIIRTKR